MDDIEPRRHTGFLIRRAQQLHVAAWSRLVSTEITSVQYSVLAVLDRRGTASQRELCEEVDLDRSTVADLVARMERRGLLRRERHPDDARRNVVALTDLGLRERRRLRPLVDAVDLELTGTLTAEDRHELRRTLRLMLEGGRPVSD